MQIELLWFSGCPSHQAAEAMMRDVLRDARVEADITRIQVEDEATGLRWCFPGSPTLRVDGVDVEPGWEPCEDCTPRCRVYATPEGLRGLPAREWVVAAVDRALGRGA